MSNGKIRNSDFPYKKSILEPCQIVSYCMILFYHLSSNINIQYKNNSNCLCMSILTTTLSCFEHIIPKPLYPLSTSKAKVKYIFVSCNPTVPEKALQNKVFINKLTKIKQI